MQINLHDYRIKNAILYLGWILFFLCLWCKGCSSSQPQTTSVTLPAITNTLPTAKGNEIVHVPIEIPKWYKDRTNEKKLSKDILEMYDRLQAYQEEIDNMHSEYQNSDSTKQAELYRLATELKKFESNFEDENLKLKINGIIGGNEIKEITPTYTIKERKIDVPQKQIKGRFLVGGGIGVNKELNQVTWKINTGLQNQKGNIIRGSFQKIGEQEYWLAEYDFSIFKIVR